MTDIVKRLRTLGPDNSGFRKIGNQAADEIERLRRELKSEKEESASYHKFWIEARDAMHKLAEKDA
jgi:hypothetical protein